MSCWSKVRSQNENVEGGRDLNEQPKLDNSHQMFNKSDVVVVALSAFFLSFGQLLAGCYCYLLLYLAYTRELMQETKVEREQSTDIVALDPAASSVLEFLWLSPTKKCDWIWAKGSSKQNRSLFDLLTLCSEPVLENKGKTL